jgi:lipid-A-disaccharide synthase
VHDGLKYIGLVNIVAGEGLVPELVQERSSPQHMADAVEKMLVEPDYYGRIRKDLEEVRKRLGYAGASDRAAAVVCEMLDG